MSAETGPHDRGAAAMERVTVRVTERRLDELEALVDAGEYPNRSEAIREGLRQLVGEDTAETRGVEDV